MLVALRGVTVGELVFSLNENLVKEEMKMPEKIVTVLENIAAVKGQDYVEGLGDMANILAPKVKPADKESEGKDNA